jgi:LacI family transcriptional regulator
MMKQKPNITDVAEVAGVSIATVSHVINGTRFVSDEVQEKVKAAINNLGYTPSSIARGLAGKETKNVGVIFSDISNPFFTELYRGLESILSPEGYHLILANTGEQDSNQEKTLQTIISRQIDGLIIAPTGRDSRMLNHLVETGVPIVLIDRDAPVDGVSKVVVDNVAAAFLATSHLLEDGKHRVGIILGLPDVSTTQTRKEGYINALKAWNIPYQEEYVINGESKIGGGYQGVKQLMQLKRPPEAILSINNLMTIGALHAFRELGLHCPIDVGLIGIDDHPWSEINTPPLTVIRQPTFEIGVRAAKILLSNTKNPKNTFEKLECSLIIRGSCSEKCLQNYLKIPPIYTLME